MKFGPSWTIWPLWSILGHLGYLGHFGRHFIIWATLGPWCRLNLKETSQNSCANYQCKDRARGKIVLWGRFWWGGGWIWRRRRGRSWSRGMCRWQIPGASLGARPRAAHHLILILITCFSLLAIMKFWSFGFKTRNVHKPVKEVQTVFHGSENGFDFCWYVKRGHLHGRWRVSFWWSGSIFGPISPWHWPYCSNC